MDRAEGALLVAEKALEVARQYAQALEDLKSNMDDAVRKAVAEAMAAIPMPKDGKPGPEGPAGAQGPAGIAGQAGKDAVIDTADIVLEVLKLVPVPKDGAAGLNGKDADSAAIAAEVLAQVRKEMPVPQNGRDGRDGAPGRDADQTEIVASVLRNVEAKIAAIPSGKDGAPGRDAEPVDPERIVSEVLKRIPTPKDGADGRSVDPEAVDAKLEAAAARWEIGMERRASEVIQAAVSRLPVPKDGANGRDGIDWSDFDAELDEDGRTIVITMGKGDQKVVKRLKTSIPVFVGSWKAGEKYEKGDCVNWGGSMWVAKQDNPPRPTEGAGWQLAVRRGADPKVS